MSVKPAMPALPTMPATLAESLRCAQDATAQEGLTQACTVLCREFQRRDEEKEGEIKRIKDLLAAKGQVIGQVESDLSQCAEAQVCFAQGLHASFNPNSFGGNRNHDRECPLSRSARWRPLPPHCQPRSFGFGPSITDKATRSRRCRETRRNCSSMRRFCRKCWKRGSSSVRNGRQPGRTGRRSGKTENESERESRSRGVGAPTSSARPPLQDPTPGAGVEQTLCDPGRETRWRL